MGSIHNASIGDAVVRLEGVRKTYRSGDHLVEALAGVNLAVPRGSIQGVIGFSGAGKSTLLRCISRLERPDGGRVIVAGADLTSLSGEALRQARRQIGVVFQHFNLLRSKSVASNVGMALELAGRPKKEIRNRVNELLEWFGLADKAQHYPSQLSGGQQQRVAIARALAMQPAVLLTDEPTSALDPETTGSVLALLRRVQREFEVTVLLITHQLDAIRAVCDRVAVLEAGCVVEEGPVEQVLLQPHSAATKRLVQHELGLFRVATPISQSPCGQASMLLELQMLGTVAAEPILSWIVRDFGVEINILRARIDRLNATQYGFLLIQMSGEPSAVARAEETLRLRGVGVTRFDQSGEYQ